MAYNLTMIGNSTGVLAFVQNVNSELMFGFLGICILLVITVISFMTFLASTNDTGKSLAATAFLAVGFALLLRFVELIPNLALFICVITAALTLAFTFKSS